MANKKSICNLHIEPRPYQTDAADWALAKQQAVCSLPTGTGKTVVAVPVGNLSSLILTWFGQ